MGLFKPGMFAKRGVTSAFKEQETPAHQPVVCAVCGLEGHDSDNCWAIIKSRADLERTWSGSQWSAGEGEMFEAMREWWQRIQGE